MIGVHGVGGLPEPAGPRSDGPRARAPEPARTPATDGVEISAAAAEAAARSQLVSRTAAGEEIRAERIERAKEQIEQGTYRLQEIVAQVAARIAPYVD